LSSAFVDTSVLLAMMFRESRATLMQSRLESYDSVFASDLAEAELRSACRRERTEVDEMLLAPLELVFPPRSLRGEIVRVLDAGYVRGADCLHLATALLIAPDPRELTFLTLDVRQRDVAKALGFIT
jgi:predicted nucleic acid-binding protein